MFFTFSVVVLHTAQKNKTIDVPAFATSRPLQMHFLLLFSRQGKLRLQKWFTPVTDREKKKVIRDMTAMVLARPARSSNFLQWRDLKIVYKRCLQETQPLAVTEL